VKSLAQMQEQCRGLIDTTDVNDWENEFLKSVCFREFLTGPQAEKLESIYKKHFA